MSLSNGVEGNPIAGGLFVFPEGPAVASGAFDGGFAGHGGGVVDLAGVEDGPVFADAGSAGAAFEVDA